MDPELINMPRLSITINKIEFISVLFINCGVSGCSILFKSNNDKMTSIIGKIYKKNNYLSNKTTFDINKYDEITEKGLSPRFISRYNINNDYNFKTTLYNVIDENIYNNFIDLYEVGGFMTVLSYINFSNDFNKLNNYKDIIKIIDIIIKKLTVLNDDLFIIQRDSHLNNVLISNNYTVYLFNLYCYYKDLIKSNTNPEQLKKYEKQLINILFKNKQLSKEFLDSNLNKDFIHLNKDIDCNLIDFDLMLDLKEIFNYTKKYLKMNDQKINDILYFILYVFKEADKLFVLDDFYYSMNEINNKNIEQIKNHIISTKKKIIDGILKNCKFTQKYNFNQIMYLIDIIHGFIYSTNEKHIINQNSFDNLFNFIYNKEFLKDNVKYFNNDKWIIIDNIFKNKI